MVCDVAGGFILAQGFCDPNGRVAWRARHPHRGIVPRFGYCDSLVALRAVFGEPALCFDRRLATHSGRGDRLSINVISAIARDIDTGDF